WRDVCMTRSQSETRQSLDTYCKRTIFCGLKTFRTRYQHKCTAQPPKAITIACGMAMRSSSCCCMCCSRLTHILCHGGHQKSVNGQLRLRIEYGRTPKTDTLPAWI